MMVHRAAMEKIMPLLRRVASFGERNAVVNRSGRWSSFADVMSRSQAIAEEIRSKTGTSNLNGKRVAILCSPGDDFVASQLATWQVGGCSVPMCISHPRAELEYVVSDAAPSAIIAGSEYAGPARELVSRQQGLRIISPETSADTDSHAVPWVPENPAMIIYTSGTTGRPKGVVTRHSALEHQIRDQIEAWGWHQGDRILNCLPLHHVHGVVNLTLVPLYVGACIEFMEPDPSRIWKRMRLGALAGGELTLFMAVPTLYAKLIKGFDSLPQKEQVAASKGAKALRLMVSGSAALPESVMHRWKEITGHTLLERYGMTEFCMGLTNPLRPESGRHPGYVGNPMPSILARIVEEETGEEISKQCGKPGSLQIKGPGVFKEYLNKPEATAKEFEDDGWFKTGDIAVFDPEKSSYKILGRASADIIKSGGYKISALDIERELLEHPDVDEVAVLGTPDDYYGERVAAVVKWHADAKEAFDEASFKNWAKSRLAAYKVPTVYRIVADIPKNAMGKVNKRELRHDMFSA